MYAEALEVIQRGMTSKVMDFEGHYYGKRTVSPVGLPDGLALSGFLCT
jgi:hypothetical protein